MGHSRTFGKCFFKNLDEVLALPSVSLKGKLVEVLTKRFWRKGGVFGKTTHFSGAGIFACGQQDFHHGEGQPSART
jgi:hypothetical protein